MCGLLAQAWVCDARRTPRGAPALVVSIKQGLGSRSRVCLDWRTNPTESGAVLCAESEDLCGGD